MSDIRSLTLLLLTPIPGRSDVTYDPKIPDTSVKWCENLMEIGQVSKAFSQPIFNRNV